MDRFRLRKEKVCMLWLGIAGGERRCLIDFHDLAYFCYLCDTSLFNKFCFVMCYNGCYCCNYIWMPLLGFIKDNIILSSYVQYSLHFQRYIIRRYGPVPINCWVAAENSLGKSFLVNMGIKIKNEG